MYFQSEQQHSGKHDSNEVGFGIQLGILGKRVEKK
jgi:hypothetical protein